MALKLYNLMDKDSDTSSEDNNSDKHQPIESRQIQNSHNFSEIPELVKHTQDENGNKHELVEIITDFTEIASKRNFKKACKVYPELTERIKGLMYIFDQVLKSTGTTEYTTIDRGYTGDQITEKYKNSVVSSWKNKTEKKNAVRKITHDEIMDGTNTYLQRRMDFQNRREKRRIDSGKAPRKLEYVTGTINNDGKVSKPGVAVFKYDKKQQEEFSSSSDDDETVINNLLDEPVKKRVIRKTSKHLEQRRRRKRLEAKASRSTSERSDTKKKIIFKSETNRPMDDADDATSRNNEYLPVVPAACKQTKQKLAELDNIHNFQMSVLDSSSDENN